MENKTNSGYGIYVLVWLGLMILTGSAIAIAGINYSNMTITIVLIIAFVQAYLILHLFMHLKREQKVFRIFAAIAGMLLLISLVLLFANYSFL
jgi:cytochrome c oxidase subunit IV